MAVVQSTYPNQHQALLAGQLVNAQTADVDTLNMTGATNLLFGMMAIQSSAAGADDRDIVPGGATNRMRGVAIQDERQQAARDGLYAAGDVVPVCWRGDIAVRVSRAVAFGNNVVAATTASGSGATREEQGQLSSQAADATHIAVPGARFMTSAAAQGVAVVRLDGLVQSS